MNNHKVIEFAKKLHQKDVERRFLKANQEKWDTLDEEIKSNYMEEARYYLSGKSPIGLPEI